MTRSGLNSRTLISTKTLSGRLYMNNHPTIAHGSPLQTPSDDKPMMRKNNMKVAPCVGTMPRNVGAMTLE
eukprot:CAMPEP_0172907072 /NCGR_PEP_ID=MMETSP1075-20121228/178107_1 /TAXON_ID=2916 /ORGANISM="Ceratium fusus, Strain PA161109" /LENGTH=69 /DNA_ID=CAMNT_0013764621 /DNA_START=32 /DNA_END=241 /DNA_ORIENTATION=+